MTSPASGAPAISGATSGVNSGLIAIGTNIRQQLVQLTVTVAPGDPAALDTLEQAIRLERVAGRITSWGRDFAALVGRDAVVAAVRAAVDERVSVAVYGERKIGKTVLLRHLAPRVGSGFRDGVARLPAGGMLWQDVGQEIVRTFFSSRIAIYLGPAQLQAVMAGLDALLLLDDLSPEAGIEQLTTILADATFVVTSAKPLLAGEARIVRLTGLAPAAVADLLRRTLASLGAGDVPVDPRVAERIGTALGGHPDRIITAVHGAHERGVDLASLAAELSADPQKPARDMADRLSAHEHAVVEAVNALAGAPVGPEHLAAMVPGMSPQQVDDLLRRRVLRAASPRVQADPWLLEVAGVAARATDREAERIRERYAAHFAEWIVSAAQSATDVAAESQAILSLLEWAEATGRFPVAHALSVAAEAPLALAGRWAAWSEVTATRLRCAEQLRLWRDAAIAFNQMGVQRLGGDDAPGARRAFEQSIERATGADAPDVAAVARHNLAIVDGGPWDPSRERRPHDGNGPAFRGPLLLAVVLAVVVGVVALMLLPRPGLAIEPEAGVFSAAAVGTDSEGSIFTVTNRGSGPIEGLEAELSGDGASEFRVVGGDCFGARLTGGESCTIELGYRPTSADRRTALLVVTADDGTSITATIEGAVAGAAGTAIPTTPPGTAATVSAASPAAPTPTPTPTPPSARPDLTIGRFAPLGEPSQGETWIIPVEVEVRNDGAVEAGNFPVVVTADGNPVVFQVADEDQVAFMTRDPLGAGDRLVLTGDLLLDSAYNLDVVTLEVAADSCFDQADAPEYCRIEEEREDNNMRVLQAADVAIRDLLVGTPELDLGKAQASPATVPVTFTVANDGTLAAEGFWLSAYVGQLQPPLSVEDYETDPATGAVALGSLNPAQALTVSGSVRVPITSLRSAVVVVAGCAPRAESCPLAEIARQNNFASAEIPSPGTVSPETGTPTAAPAETPPESPPTANGTPTPYTPP